MLNGEEDEEELCLHTVGPESFQNSFNYFCDTIFYYFFFSQIYTTKAGNSLVHKSSSALIMLMKMKQLGSNHHKQVRWNFQFKCCSFQSLQSYFDFGLRTEVGNLFDSLSLFPPQN